jgi:predicted peptidase
MHRSRVFLAALALSVPLTAAAADYNGLIQRTEKRTFSGASGETLPYRLFVPANYDRRQKYPLIIFLHGAGERGDDNSLQLKNGEVLRFISDEVQAKHPCLLIAPQCAVNRKWSEVDWSKRTPPELPAEPSKPMNLLMGLLDALPKEYSIDPDRVYITGLSMGGYGTYDLVMRLPDRFAAAIPVCGGGDVTRAKQVAHVPMWIFHGGADGVVFVGLSQKMVETLREAGASPRYTEYPGVGHNSWSRAYEEPELVEWLFTQHRGAAK